jgi:hypothetical protein
MDFHWSDRLTSSCIYFEARPKTLPRPESLFPGHIKIAMNSLAQKCAHLNKEVFFGPSMTGDSGGTEFYDGLWPALVP